MLDTFGECASPCGMIRNEPASFARRALEAIQVAELDFLDRRHASDFSSNTASFSMRVALYSPDIPSELNPTRVLEGPRDIPPIHVCHLQAALNRTMEQFAPGVKLSRTDRNPRDIWCVEPDAGNPDRVLADAIGVFQTRAPRWFRRYSNRPTLRLVLLVWQAWLDLLGVLGNIGTLGSAFRKQLLRALEKSNTR